MLSPFKMADERDQKEEEEECTNKNELTAKQRKNKKKKEAAKKKKQEQKEKNEESESQKDVSSQETMSPQEKLEEELMWCISQLEIGLKAQKPDKTTASQTENLIKNLKSPKVPLPKKRQIMRSVFGDYRKKMQEDTKKAKSKDLEQEKSLKVFPVKKGQQRSVFIRVANDQLTTKDDKSDEKQQSIVQAADSSSTWKFEPSSGDFKFNFETNEQT